MWRSRSSHHREHGGNAAAAQLVRSHHGQQIFPVLLQGKARRPHLTILPVHLKTAVAACKENEVQDDVGARFTKEWGINAPSALIMTSKPNKCKQNIFCLRDETIPSDFLEKWCAFILNLLSSSGLWLHHR